MKRLNNEKNLLTQAEKSFIKAVIKPYKKYCSFIVKLKDKVGELYIYIRLGGIMTNTIALPINQFSNTYQFKGLEYGTFYELKTLGLWR